MQPDPLHELDGSSFYYGFLAGSRKILQHQEEINKLNVFPVPDADTGTNLASTIRTIMDQSKPDDRFHITANSIAEAALDGARGNSGVIFAQFLYGLSREVGHSIRLTTAHFAETIHKSVRYVYDAIGDPREGTMISVIRDWAEHLCQLKDKVQDFVHLMTDSYHTAQKSLERTTTQLDVLAKAGVVDAGAKGFVLFLEGMLEFFHLKISREELRQHINDIPVLEIEEAEINHDQMTYRFCTEAMIEGKHLDKTAIRKMAQSAGDSLVLAGSDHKLRLHIHTDDPAGLFHQLRTMGDLTFQKAEDMYRQYAIAHERKWDIGLLTDSASDLPEELMHHYQIQMNPINLYFGKNHYLDKVTITPDYFYDMLDQSPVYPNTAQANVKSFTNLYSHMSSHYRQVIALHLSEKLSGTVNSSRKAAEMIGRELKREIAVFDSKNISGGLGLVLLRTARAIESGMSFAEISSLLPEWIDKCKLYVAPATMKYFIKGGRVSKLKGLVARLLHVLPVISMDAEGKTETFDKAFSHKAVMQKVLELVKKFRDEKKVWEYAIVHAHSPQNADYLARETESLLGKAPAYIQNLSPVIGLHAGLGTVGIALMPE